MTDSSFTQLRAHIDLYPAMIFDMDGTIMNSEIWHHKAWNTMLAEFGLPTLTTEELYAYGGMPTLAIARDVVKRFNSEVNPEDMTTRKVEIYRSTCLQHAEPFEFMVALLKELAASGKRIAVATSSHRPEAEFLLGKYGVLPYVDALITGDLVHKGKPNPEIYLLAAQGLNVRPEDSLVFEDTVIGLQGATNARMDAVKVFEGAFDCTDIIRCTR